MQGPLSDSSDNGSEDPSGIPPSDSYDEEKPSLATLRGALADLPDATYQDFREIKTIWEPRMPPLHGTGPPSKRPD